MGIILIPQVIPDSWRGQRASQRGGGVIKTAADAVSGPHPSPPPRAGEGAGVWT